jgi:hypothetical protein
MHLSAGQRAGEVEKRTPFAARLFPTISFEERFQERYDPNVTWAAASAKPQGQSELQNDASRTSLGRRTNGAGREK